MTSCTWTYAFSSVARLVWNDTEGQSTLEASFLPFHKAAPVPHHEAWGEMLRRPGASGTTPTLGVAGLTAGPALSSSSL